MKEVKITCDECQKDLSVTGPMPRFRVTIHCEKLPSDSEVQYAVFTEPHFYGERHFCNPCCLALWSKKQLQKA